MYLQGPDVLHKFTPIEAVLAVHLLEVQHPKPSTAAAAGGATAGEQGPAMFDPPLGELVARLMWFKTSVGLCHQCLVLKAVTAAC